MSKKISIPSVPKLTSGDLRESAEMVRAAMTMLRQAYSVVWLRRTSFNDVPDDSIKDFTEHFDKVQSFLFDTHNVLMNHYGAYIEIEKSNSKTNVVPSSSAS